jgi:ATP-dependent DNA helicase RecG
VNPLSEPIAGLLGSTAARIQKAWPEVVTVGDLLLKFPKHYHERGELSGRDLLVVGEFATVVGRVAKIDVRPMRKPRKGDVSTVHIDLDGRTVTATFFNQGKWIQGKLPVGSLWMFSGKVDLYRSQLQLQHPEVERVLGTEGHFPEGAPLTEEEQKELARLAPSVQASPFVRIYPPAIIRTAKATKVALTNNALAFAITTLLNPLDDVPDPVPAEILHRHGMPDLLTALRLIHHPQSPADWKLGLRRFPFAEAITLQTLLAQRRRRVREIGAVPRPRRTGGLLEDFDLQLPFRLTRGQELVSEQVFADLARGEPMGRLLQGDVGSGKTVVALRAMLSVVDAGGQAVLLAPTEVLAAQHARLVTSLLGPLGRAGELDAPDHATRVALLTGSLPTAARRRALLDIASGAAGIVIGTHALLQEGVDFDELALVVVDEQHRFGVEQRAALQAKASTALIDRPLLAHLLVMTATPIPRTIAMTVFGDLDISTLTEMPAGREPVATTVVPASNERWMQRVWERVAEEVRNGRQVYVVCPRIGGAAAEDDVDPDDGAVRKEQEPNNEAPDPADSWTITDLLPELQSEPALAGVRIAPLHGRMHPDEKDETMRAFASGAIDVLLATTVIEVGVDVANATAMVIMAADRFGLSQLHQLRGRVGRGDHPGLCLLVTSVPDGEPSRERLDQVAATNDGFVVAEIDLRAREEGNVLGQSQHGKSRNLRYLSVINDMDILEETRMDAFALVEDDPALTAHPLLAEACLFLDAESEGSFLDKA